MTATALPRRSFALRSLALPAEHGGWGFLAEPVVLGLLAAPSLAGALVAASAVFGFLARHPLKLAVQDARHGRHYPRTRYCQAFALGYGTGAIAALAAAVAISGIGLLVPLALAAPFAIVQAAGDVSGRGRGLLAEMTGATAMALTASSIAIAGNMQTAAAYGLAGILVARFIPSIAYVRAMLGRFSRVAAVLLHVAALVAVASHARPGAIAAMAVLLLRAVWGVTHTPPPVRTIGWREIAFGAMTVALAAL